MVTCARNRINCWERLKPRCLFIGAKAETSSRMDHAEIKAIVRLQQ